MQSLFQQRRIWVLSAAFFFGWMLTASDLVLPGWGVRPVPASAQTLLPGPWMEIEVSAEGKTVVFPAGLTATEPQWAQRFERVNDYLELRVGSAQGTLISWGDKGERGRYTWMGGDGAETRDIAQWVGTGTQIKLWARVW